MDRGVVLFATLGDLLDNLGPEQLRVWSVPQPQIRPNLRRAVPTEPESIQRDNVGSSDVSLNTPLCPFLSFSTGHWLEHPDRPLSHRQQTAPTGLDARGNLTDPMRRSPAHCCTGLPSPRHRTSNVMGRNRETDQGVRYDTGDSTRGRTSYSCDLFDRLRTHCNPGSSSFRTDCLNHFP